MKERASVPVLYIVVPCYNEQEVLPITSGQFLAQLQAMAAAGKVSAQSKILFVDDGSRDSTWDIITRLAADDARFAGIRQSRNRGHQNAVLAGLMEAKDRADITISIDCDGQDDIGAMEKMVDEYRAGSEIVYGVRSSRRTDTFFKRFTAQSFYRLLRHWGAEVVFNHADYRLVSSRVLEVFADFHEVNLFLRGMFPLVGFKSTCVSYERHERLAGKSHYPLAKMLALAFDGITSLSVKPVRIITLLGIFGALRDYGFSETDGGFCLRQSVAGGQFALEVFVSAEGVVSSRMLDEDSGSEYTLYKVAGASGAFVGAAREEAERVLSAVAERCFVPDVFRSEASRAVIDYAAARYGSRPEFLWKNLSENAVLRRTDSRKWFAVLAIVAREKLGLAGSGRVEIIDLRISPYRLSSTLDGQRFLPGWHMNKRTWYTALLDGSVPTDDLIRRLDESWRLAGEV